MDPKRDILDYRSPPGKEDPPPGRIVYEWSDQGLRIRVPRLGWVSPAGFSAVYLALTACFLIGMMVLVREKQPLLILLLLLPFGMSVFGSGLLFNRASQSYMLEATPRGFRSICAGPFGRREEFWSIDEIDDITVDRMSLMVVRFSVNTKVVLSGRRPHELLPMANALRTALNTAEKAGNARKSP